jgi:hypothetical protein
MVHKKIQKSIKGQSVGGYVKAVVKYILNPESEPDPETGLVKKGERCVASETHGMYENDVDGLIDEMADNAREKIRTNESQPVVHRVISFQTGERPSQETIFAIGRQFMRDLGYDESHQYVMGIHDNTDNLHLHIVSNRYSTYDGKLLEEGHGWDKLEGRRACVRLEKEYGLGTEPGSQFVATEEKEIVREKNPFTGKITERERYCIIQERPPKTVPALRDRVQWHEFRTGLKSHQSMLQEIFTEIRPQLNESLKFGHYYKLLAERGVQCELVKHGNNHYLTYSLDGQKWEKPTDIHRDFTSKSLEKILGSRVRKPKEVLNAIVNEARQRIDNELNTPLTDEATKQMVYSKNQVNALRLIPLEDVQKAFDIQSLKPENKKVKNAVDAMMYQKKMTYPEAVDALAQRFPEIISGKGLVNDIDQIGIKKRLDLAGVPDTLRRSGADVLKQLDAWGCDKFFVYGNAPDRNFSSATNAPEGWTKEDVLKNLAFLAKMNLDGGHIYVDPQHDSQKIKIPVDDVKQAFIEKYRPSMTLATSREKQQAHYVIDRKYEKEFYDILTENINDEWGDPKIKTADHDSRLAGMTNRKKHYADAEGNFPFVKVIQSTPVRCTDFEKYVDDQYELYIHGKLKRLNSGSCSSLSSQSDRNKAMEDIEENTMSPKLTNEAIIFQEKFQKNYGQNIDRSRADFATADFLYRRNATPGQVYAFLKRNALQNDDLVTRKHSNGTKYDTKKNVSEAAKDRHARRTAINAIFDKGHAVKTATAKFPSIKKIRIQMLDRLPGTSWGREQAAKKQVAHFADPNLQNKRAEQLTKEQEARRKAAEQAAAKAAAAAKKASEAEAARSRAAETEAVIIENVIETKIEAQKFEPLQKPEPDTPTQGGPGT